MADTAQVATGRRRRRWLVAAGVGLVVVIGLSRVIWPPAPSTIGVRGGGLSPCPGTPNCVHTGLRHPAGTRGIFLDSRTGRRDLVDRLVEVIEEMPRTRVITVTDGYVHAEARSRVFRFIDDLELLILPDWELVVRSASRVGRSDAGVNGRRVEELRERLGAAGLLQ